MKAREFLGVIAATAAASLVLSACTAETPSTSPSPTDSSTDAAEEPGEEPAVDDEIYYSVGADQWSGYNSNHSATYNVWTSVINARVHSGFTYYEPDGTIVQNEEFGSFEMISDDPLTVKYNVVDEAVWSDGEPIDYVDALLDWASQNATFLSLDDDGNAIQDEKGEDVPAFNSVSYTLGEYAPEPPAGEFGGKEFTYTYSEAFPDWQLMVSGFYPSHVVAKALGLTKEELGQAILDGDAKIISDAGKFWNEGWANPAIGTFPDAELIPVSGPYTYGSWEAGNSLTLVRNEAFWGEPAKNARLTFRFVAPDQHVQALRNGDLHVIEPQATVDTMAQLEGAGEGITIENSDSLTWEHIDFNQNEGASAFAGNLALREAFAYCVPRQQIVDTLIAPLTDKAQVMNAREVFPFQTEKYNEVVGAAYDGRYDEVDLDLARAKFEEAGVTGPVDVKIAHAVNNQRRSDTVDLIKASCDQVGFNVIGSPSEDFSNRYFTGAGENWDVALFAWAGSGQIASGRNIYHSKGGQNGAGFSNADVDAAFDQLATSLDPAVQLEAVKKAESGLWADLHGLPLYAHPGVVAYDSTIQNVRPTATQTMVVWNAHQWERVS